LIYEEFFWLECGVALKRSKARAVPGMRSNSTIACATRVKAMLPFKPTGAQKRVLKEIAEDMAAPHPMNRLLQGDVGSGKTIVAAEAAVIAIENGYQVAVLAPDRNLATQHSFTFKQILGKLGYVTALLTGQLYRAGKSAAQETAVGGLVHVAIGTHALIQKDVEFKNLGPRDHRRAASFRRAAAAGLVQKGVTPDVLVMTATPIPRTLAMTMYGDLDVSVIDEMPPGRKPIVTKHSTADHIEKVYSFMKAQIDEGRQAYVVYPVIEESETQAMKAAQKEYEHLAREVFPKIPVGLMHGGLGADEKESVMQRFKDGQIKILVSTDGDRRWRGCARTPA
jgi:ATP-dependent DNA helicase RecG